MWWNDRWRYRTEVARSAPWRDDAPHPVEVAVDFSALLAEAGIDEKFDPASLRVVEALSDGGPEIPFACRTEYVPQARRNQIWLAWMAQPTNGSSGHYHIYFDTEDRGIARAEYDVASLPPENLIANPGFEDRDADGRLPAGWTATPIELVRLGRFEHTTGERSLKIVVDEKTPENLEREVTLSQIVDVCGHAGCEMVFECDLFAQRAPYGAPVSVELQQFRADGSRILEWAVQPRWLTIDLAQGQLVQFRERGRFSPEAAMVNVHIRFRCHVKDTDTAETIPPGADTCFTIWLDRLVMRPGERWPWPAETHGGYVEGALENAPLNRAFQFTGRRRLFFNAGSEGALSSGTYNPNPRSVHWGPEAGTLEFWCCPTWGDPDESERIFFEGTIQTLKLQSCLSKVWADGESLLKFLIVDSDGIERQVTGPAAFEAGQWHHVAVTWDCPKAHLQVFFDGKCVGEQGPGDAPWASSAVPTDKAKKPSRFGLMEDDVRSLPMQAYIGGDKDCLPEHSAEATLDEFRISDISRYSGDFIPPRREFETDEATRVLFHFENECDGVHDSNDRFVQGHLICELPRYEHTAPLEIRSEAGIERRKVCINPAPEPGSFEANRAKSWFDVDGEDRELPDPRFIVHSEREAKRVVQDEPDAFTIDVGGDFAPQMRSITFQRAEGAGDETTLLPRWRANDNVLPFSLQDIVATLAAGAEDDADRAMKVFKYALDTSHYFNSRSCETLPTRHRLRNFWTFLKAINIYPLTQCGPMNFTLGKLFLAVGISCNSALGTRHQFLQAFYDGRWRLFDLSPRTYWLERDNKTVAPWRTLEEDPYLLLRECDMLKLWMRGSLFEPMIGQPERPHKMDFPLRPGERASVCWHNEGRWIELCKERERLPLPWIPPHFGNGAIEYTPAAGGEATSLDNMLVETTDAAIVLRVKDPARGSSLIYRAQCPYIFTDACVSGVYKGAMAAPANLSISFDRGKTWTQVWRSCEQAGKIDASLFDLVSARYEYWLKLDLPASSDARVTDFHVRTTLAVSPTSLPGKLSLGHNRITFADGPPTVPVNTVCRWVERSRSDLGVSLNTISYYLNGDETHRNLLIVAPGQEAALDVTLLGRAFQGEIALCGLPDAWLNGPDRQDIDAEGNRDAIATTFRIGTPSDAAPGDIRGFDVVLREAGEERRVAAQVLVADAPLVREAELADEVTGEVTLVDLPEASGARVMRFTGDGTLQFAFSAAACGRYALWLRGQWDNPKQKNTLTLALDGGEGRLLSVKGLIGFWDWRNEDEAHTKKYQGYGDGDTYWYRIQAISLKPGEHTLELGAQAGATFDALALLPENPVMDRAAMNLFQNWNYAPWQNPF